MVKYNFLAEVNFKNSYMSTNRKALNPSREVISCCIFQSTQGLFSVLDFSRAEQIQRGVEREGTGSIRSGMFSSIKEPLA